MANHKSAEKQARASLRKRLNNRTYLSTVRTAVKKARTAIAAVKPSASKTDQKTVQDLICEAQSLLAKAAKKNMIHRNNASRYVSRLTKAFSRNLGQSAASKK